MAEKRSGRRRDCPTRPWASERLRRRSWCSGNEQTSRSSFSLPVSLRFSVSLSLSLSLDFLVSSALSLSSVRSLLTLLRAFGQPKTQKQAAHRDGDPLSLLPERALSLPSHQQEASAPIPETSARRRRRPRPHVASLSPRDLLLRLQPSQICGRARGDGFDEEEDEEGRRRWCCLLCRASHCP